MNTSRRLQTCLNSLYGADVFEFATLPGKPIPISQNNPFAGITRADGYVEPQFKLRDPGPTKKHYKTVWVTKDGRIATEAQLAPMSTKRRKEFKDDSGVISAGLRFPSEQNERLKKAKEAAKEATKFRSANPRWWSRYKVLAKAREALQAAQDAVDAAEERLNNTPEHYTSYERLKIALATAKRKLEIAKKAEAKAYEKRSKANQPRYKGKTPRARLQASINKSTGQWTSWGRMSGAPMPQQVMVTIVPSGYLI